MRVDKGRCGDGYGEQRKRPAREGVTFEKAQFLYESDAALAPAPPYGSNACSGRVLVVKVRQGRGTFVIYTESEGWQVGMPRLTCSRQGFQAWRLSRPGGAENWAPTCRKFGTLNTQAWV